ncbi:hypothetical protein LTR78_005657 [Recurvomyces mirabilis]|uniref:Frequency clock protein n=1 Tax=Recurvomyces mirabilis TaxID=574656 RepID=A0AAE0WMP1_9PEZI|nr:hypothetical protein LTR78_005657 [Recurvomyces mirabilis]KAK5151220.1 hypothetical protein LTS14_009390 [Recurvomyces mirabilis]
MTSETGPAVNPRRVAAQHSVSLLHGNLKQPARNESSEWSSGGNPLNLASVGTSNSSLPSSLQPFGQVSSGESSNVQEWFEKSNNAVCDQAAPFKDESPFFMRQSESSHEPASPALRYVDDNDGAPSPPFPAALMHLGTEGSSTDDFRGVIDDLTIENKRLKKRLRRYEKLHDSHLKDEKLFEVRIHGLPPHKKRELEETLRKFATGLGQQGQFPANGYEGLLPMPAAQKTTSSQASLLNDSAYASMSASGQGGSSGPSSDTMYKRIKTSAASRHQNIHSYLHHIPGGLLPPPNPATMTERAKKKLVVRRLEQIFAGKGAPVTGHQQPMQQQEVSHMAARADRSALEASGGRARQEGVREAHIMSQDHEDAKQESPTELLAAMKSQAATIREQDSAGESPAHTATEQRPTRPLDLDPQRAQIPADNVAYFRNLGFSPPEPDSRRTPEEGHGWLYLNLLINLAQLHTINVTMEYVQNAISEYSDRFEIPQDGRKVRWKGHQRKNKRHGNDGSGESAEQTNNASEDQSPRKRAKLSHRTGGHGTTWAPRHLSGAATSRSANESNRHTYTPLFSHREGSDGSCDSSTDQDDNSSPFPTANAGDSSMMTRSGIRTTTTRAKTIKDDGPITFYNDTRFCTDLSSERNPGDIRNAPAYVAFSAHPLGGLQNSPTIFAERRGPLHTTSKLPEPVDLDDDPIPENMEINFAESSPSASTGLGKQRTPIKDLHLEVTGMGGVWPADHFQVDVQAHHVRPTQPMTRYTPALPPKLAGLLRGDRPKRVAVQHQVISSSTKVLPPTELPPALGYMPFANDYHDDDDSDTDDNETSVSPDSPHAEPRSPAPQPLDMYLGESDEEADEDDDSDMESDTSVDFLAQARQMDPDSIRAKEREYDLQVAEHLAEEIPAGSSAATAGGGSGFASPADGVERAEYRRGKQEVRAVATAAALQRATEGNEAIFGMRQ